MMPVFMMKRFDQENMRQPWSRLGRVGDDRLKVRVRISPKRVFSQQPRLAMENGDLNLDGILCPCVMEELFKDNRQECYRQCSGHRTRARHCCDAKVSDPQKAGKLSGARCSSDSRTEGENSCCGANKYCKTRSECPLDRSKKPRQIGLSADTTDYVRGQSQAAVGSLDALMEHLLGQVFSQSSEKVRECEKRATENAKAGSVLSQGEETSCERSEQASTESASTSIPAVTESDQTQRKEKSAQSGAQNLHDLLDIVFSAVLGEETYQTNDDYQQMDKRTEDESSSSCPGVRCDVTKHRVVPDPGVSLSEMSESDGNVEEEQQDGVRELGLKVNPEIPVADECEFDIIDEGELQTVTAVSDKYTDHCPDDYQENNGPNNNCAVSAVIQGESNPQKAPESEIAKLKPDHAADHQIPSEAPKFSMSFDLSDFNPDEIRVTNNLDKLTVTASHEITENGITTEHSVHKSITLPSGVDAESLRCRLHNDGHMTVSADYIEISGKC